MLTGKAENDFNKFLVALYREDKDYLNINDSSLVEMFSRLPDSFKWGVFVDFFDSHKIAVEVNYYSWSKTYLGYINDKTTSTHEFNTLAEARTAALKKANDLYNIGS